MCVLVSEICIIVCLCFRDVYECLCMETAPAGDAGWKIQSDHLNPV